VEKRVLLSRGGRIPRWAPTAEPTTAGARIAMAPAVTTTFAQKYFFKLKSTEIQDIKYRRGQYKLEMNTIIFSNSGHSLRQCSSYRLSSRQYTKTTSLFLNNLCNSSIRLAHNLIVSVRGGRRNNSTWDSSREREGTVP